MTNKLFKFVPSSDPQLEDDMYEFIVDPDYHIQVVDPAEEYVAYYHDQKAGVIKELGEFGNLFMAQQCILNSRRITEEAKMSKFENFKKIVEEYYADYETIERRLVFKGITEAEEISTEEQQLIALKKFWDFAWNNKKHSLAHPKYFDSIYRETFYDLKKL